MPALDEFQHEAIAFLNAARGRAILADPMGARKTGTTLSWLAQSDARRVLIVAPKVVHAHWRDEAGVFWPEAHVLTGSRDKATRHALLGVVQDVDRVGMYITSYEAMKADEKAIIAAKFDTVIYDEGHRLKGRTTAVAKVANAVTKLVKHLVCVTGTPQLNHPAELWQYLHMIDRKTYRSFWTWAEENFIIKLQYAKGRREPYRVIGGIIPGREEVLRNQLSHVLIQRELHDIFDEAEHPWIAEPLYVPIEVELSPKERKLYEQFVKFSWGQTPKGTVTAANKLVVSGRLEQLTSDWGTLDDQFEAGSKATAAKELILDLVRKEPVVVFTQYLATARRLHAMLEKSGLRAALWTSETSDWQEWGIKAWGNGDIDVVVGTYSSMREGLDGLQHRSATMVLLDLLWVPGLVDQAIGRLRRSGQLGRVSVYVLFATNTIDVTKFKALLRKVNALLTMKGKSLADIVYGRVMFESNDELEIVDE